MFGGFCLLFLPCLVGGLPVFLLMGCGLFCFLPDIFLVLGQIFLIRIHLSLMGCFCLESLILAQDERWRRA